VGLTVDPRATRPRSSALAVLGGSELYVELAGVVDPAAERQRIEKEITRVAERIEFAKAKLAKPDFAERAPAEIVAKERERLAEQEAVRAKLVASLGWFDDAGRERDGRQRPPRHRRLGPARRLRAGRARRRRSHCRGRRPAARRPRPAGANLARAGRHQPAGLDHRPPALAPGAAVNPVADDRGRCRGGAPARRESGRAAQV